MTTPLLHVDHLTFCYGNHTVLRDISFAINKGDFYAIVGPNGCGKTTLLRCMMRLLTPTAGNIAVEGIPVEKYGARLLAQKMAIVHQQVTTDFDFTAEELVMMGRNPYQKPLQSESDTDHQVVQHSMQLTNTWQFRHKLLSQLSGGERQRVMIARALSQQTPILLLDEPIANLDIAHQFDIMELLRHANRQQHKTILIVIHDLNMAYHYCPDVLLMSNGHLVGQGITKQILSQTNLRTVFGIDATISDNGIMCKPLR